MADPDVTEPGSKRGGVSPVLIVAGVAVVAFVGAFLAFRGGGSKSSETVVGGNQTTATTTAASAGCGTGAADAAYAVAMSPEPDPPRSEGTTFHLTITHDGKPVTGAKVCMVADMTEMHHEGIISEAKESSGGKYDASLKFGMRGPYAASVVITEAGTPAVSVPVTFQVA